jgi:hypothetical protein
VGCGWKVDGWFAPAAPAVRRLKIWGNMRLASIILASLPFAVLIGFLCVLFAQTGPEGFGVFFMMLYACALLTVLSAIAVVLAFLRRPASTLDRPARVLSIISVAVLACPGAFGVLFFIMSLNPPPLSY